MIILFFESQKPYILDILSSSALVFPYFKDLEWRFETDVSISLDMYYLSALYFIILQI